jgi:hypothetical protein
MQQSGWKRPNFNQINLSPFERAVTLAKKYCSLMSQILLKCKCCKSLLSSSCAIALMALSIKELIEGLIMCIYIAINDHYF